MRMLHSKVKGTLYRKIKYKKKTRLVYVLSSHQKEDTVQGNIMKYFDTFSESFKALSHQNRGIYRRKNEKTGRRKRGERERERFQ